MNVNQLKAFLGDKPAHLGADTSLKNQLRESGLRQAATLQANQAQGTADKFSSSASFGARVYANALNTTLEVDAKKPDFSAKKSAQATQPLFDFEEVAKNVLKFVGGAIKNAKNNGADDTQLNKLFDQATSGVLKGIKMAEKDLAGLMNEEIRAGIDNSKKLIDEGIESLRKDIFANAEALQAKEAKSVSNTTQISVTQQQSGQLLIKTKDGDEVTLAFEDFKQFELNQKVMLQQQRVAANVNDQVEVKPKENSSAEVDDLAGTESELSQSSSVGEEPNSNQTPSNISPNKENATLTLEQKSYYYETNSLSFSVTGELDEAELKAIGQLVSDANSLADDFFNGDIESAYNQALKLGFDDKELTSFALQLTKVENTQVIKAYETVSHYGQTNSESEPSKAVKPVAQYLDKMLSVVEGSRQQLQGAEDYENMVNSLINRMGEVHTPDLITALNRFHAFNQKLIENLPLVSR